ncbi:branched-chain amino acid ABC transporter permease [Actinomadura geliboluensis]|uniref:Branched-chain amino acid ABC transporter permease n=1 Tax=Actinomadura geliboluensis TaxID=882440 RepID=A0A5S4H7A0_9ACTN|nr:branched-chain amino acid ABC transporter permease [Actinomadura geliboluensis]TMR40634.1 branched-chain amino acid ABC transporter permease [Actinomadura geliboluensis]
MSTLAQLLVAGVVTGAIYALIAAGYTVVYTATGFVNFALGAQAMVAGYFVYVFLDGWSLPVRFAVSVGVSLLIAMVSWTLFYRFVTERDMLAAVIMSFGFAIVLQEIVRLAAGTSTLPAPSPFGDGSRHWGAVAVSDHSIGTVAVCAVLLALLIAGFRSRRGASIRAIFQDREMAEMLGIRTHLVTTTLFAVSGVLAAVACVLIGPILSMSPSMGTRLALIAFVGAVLGGLDRTETAVAGGVLLGVLEALFAGYVSADYRTSLVFAVFVLVLVVRPAGVFRTAQKVKV